MTIDTNGEPSEPSGQPVETIDEFLSQLTTCDLQTASVQQEHIKTYRGLGLPQQNRRCVTSYFSTGNRKVCYRKECSNKPEAPGNPISEEASEQHVAVFQELFHQIEEFIRTSKLAIKIVIEPVLLLESRLSRNGGSS